MPQTALQLKKFDRAQSPLCSWSSLGLRAIGLRRTSGLASSRQSPSFSVPNGVAGRKQTASRLLLQSDVGAKQACFQLAGTAIAEASSQCCLTSDSGCSGETMASSPISSACAVMCAAMPVTSSALPVVPQQCTYIAVIRPLPLHVTPVAVEV